jgi:diguanylate cyclase (GGDEF)-like protein
VLVHVASVLGAEKRAEDVLGRIGGEEFLLLQPDQTPAGAWEAADRLRRSVASAAFAHRGSTLAVTLSGGVAVYPADGVDWDALFSVADRRLYEAKRAGRNRIEGAAADVPRPESERPRVS